jgi:hypothetical protein
MATVEKVEQPLSQPVEPGEGPVIQVDPLIKSPKRTSQR